MKNKRNTNILIIGGNFIGKGAEAMMLTLRDTIKEVIPNPSIYAIQKYDSEEKLFSDNGFIPLKIKRVHIFKKFLLLTKIILLKNKKNNLLLNKRTKSLTLSDIFQSTDIVIDISGFASGDQWGWKKAIHRAIDYNMANYSRNMIFFMPQSWGPFNNYKVRVLTKLLLRTTDIVFAREKLSYDYLIKHKCVNQNKLFLSNDIAFNFKANDKSTSKIILSKIGINSINKIPLIAITPNVRIYQKTIGEGINNEYIKELFKVIDFFLSNTNCNILLIPHEFFKNSNDLQICKLIKENYNNDRLIITPKDLSASEVKGVIGLCDFIIASRYHSLVFALSKRVVPVVVGWSHKYDELLKLLNLEKLVVDPVNRKDENLKIIIENVWNNKNKYKEIINKNMPDIEKESYLPIQKLKDLLT